MRTSVDRSDLVPTTLPFGIDTGNPIFYEMGDPQRFSLSVQDETPPTYRYVSVSRPIIETREADVERDFRPMARRYFGIDDGGAFTAASAEYPNTVFVMRAEKWRTVDSEMRRHYLFLRNFSG